MANSKNSLTWDSVMVQKGGYIYHGHRINLEHMSDEQRNSLFQELGERKITFSLRNATVDSPSVHAGDLTLRVIEPDSVEKLRYQYFGWVKRENGSERPIKETITEYNQRQEAIEKLKEQQKINQINVLQKRLDELRK